MPLMTDQISPLVSIMMPAFNAERYIAAAIESVLSQTMEDWELIIINDGSTDKTIEVLKHFNEERIRVFHQPNSGEAAARNLALQKVRGAYLAFLDADDQWLPEFLQEMVASLNERLDFEGVYCDGYHINPQDEILSSLSDNRRGPFEGELLDALVRASDVFGPPICILLRTEAVRRAGVQFDTRIVIGPDWDFFTQLSQSVRFAYLDRKLLRYRVHSSNITLTAGNKKRLESLVLCREKAIHLPVFDQLSLDTRHYAFYDLLINLLDNNEEKQEEITGWAQFKALPARQQANLFRRMAARQITEVGNDRFVKMWLRRALALNPASIKSLFLFILYSLRPDAAATILRRRSQNKSQDQKRSPFSLPQ